MSDGYVLFGRSKVILTVVTIVACSHEDRLDALEQLVRRDAGFDASTQ